MNPSFSRLERIELLIQSSKWRRILSRPLKYLKGHSIKQISRLNKKGYLVQTKTYFNSSMYLYLPSGLDIYLFGTKTHSSELRLAKFLMNQLKDESVFFDVGAHFGYFTLLAEQCNCKSIFAFEASPNNFDILKKNIKANTNTTINNIAISNSNDPIEFYEFPPLYAEYNSMEINQFESSDWIKRNSPIKRKINAITLDDFIQENNVVPTIIKIDVEGAELKVLEGLKNTLLRHKPIVAMEYILDAKIDLHQAAFDFMQTLGFQCHLILDGGELTYIDSIASLKSQSNCDSENIIFQYK